MWPAYNPPVEDADSGDGDLSVSDVDDSTAAALTGVLAAPAAAAARRAPLPATRVAVADAAACFASGTCAWRGWWFVAAVRGGCAPVFVFVSYGAPGSASAHGKARLTDAHTPSLLTRLDHLATVPGTPHVVVVVGAMDLGRSDAASGVCRDLRCACVRTVCVSACPAGKLPAPLSHSTLERARVLNTLQVHDACECPRRCGSVLRVC